MSRIIKISATATAAVTAILTVVYLVLQIIATSYDVVDKVQREPTERAAPSAPPSQTRPPATTGSIDKKPLAPRSKSTRAEKSFFEDPFDWFRRNAKPVERDIYGDWPRNPSSGP